MEVGERGKTTGSKIPMARNLGRRSSSVTDMKKVFEKPETSSSSGTSSPGGQMVSTYIWHVIFYANFSCVSRFCRMTENF